MRSAWLEITDICNLKCPYCYMNANEKKEYIKMNEFKKILCILKKMNYEFIILSGGEPTMHPQIVSMMQEATAYGFKIGLTTNGTVLSQNIISALKQYNVVVQVSLDSLNPELFLASRGVNRLEIVLDNIEKLISNDIQLTLSVTLSNNNSKEILDICNYATEKAISTLHFGILMQAQRCKRNLLNLDNLCDVLISLYKFQNEHFWDIRIDIVEEVIRRIVLDKKEVYYCNAMEGKNIQIDVQGNCFQCGITQNNNNNNIFAERFKDSFSKSLELISVDNITKCSNCEFKYLCLGGCRACSYLEYGNLHKENPYCQEYMRFFKYILREHNEGKIQKYESFLKFFYSGFSDKIDIF